MAMIKKRNRDDQERRCTIEGAPTAKERRSADDEGALTSNEHRRPRMTSKQEQCSDEILQSSIVTTAGKLATDVSAG